MSCGYASLVGRPNAGKSTLLNRLVGEKLAIVSDKPQTTRHRILGVRTYPTGQIIFLDTPGIHRPLHRMNVQMVEAAVETFGQVDVLLVVVDASSKVGQGDRYVLSLLERVTCPTFLVLNKIDRIDKPRLLPLIEWYRTRGSFAEIVPVSALTGEGVDVLEQQLLARMPPGEPLYPPDFLTDQPERFFAAEIVREKVLRHTRAELPFSTAVVLDRYEEPSEAAGGVVRIHASILVERTSQKAIVIGRKGALIARIGTEAREELERFLGRRVFLDLHVRVRPNWREDVRWLSAMGLRDHAN